MLHHARLADHAWNWPSDASCAKPSPQTERSRFQAARSLWPGLLKAWASDELEEPQAQAAENLIQRRLTPELSRTALRPRRTHNLSAGAEAAKRSRLERIVRSLPNSHPCLPDEVHAPCPPEAPFPRRTS